MMSVQHQTYSHLPSHRASPPINQYQTILLADRHMYVNKLAQVLPVEWPGLLSAPFSIVSQTH